MTNYFVNCLLGILLLLIIVSPVQALDPKISANNMTSNSLPAGFNASVSSQYSSSYEAWKVFDGVSNNNANAWQTPGGVQSGWVQQGLATPMVATEYAIVCAVSYTSSAPKDFKFEGSNDNSTFTVLDTRTGQSWSSNELKNYSFSNTNAYLYYRLNITATQGAVEIFVNELYFYGTNPAIVVPVASFTKNQTSCTDPCTVAFTDTSTGPPTGWQYSSTDTSGNNTETIFSTLQNPITVFRVGTHNIKLNATNSLGFDKTTGDSWVNVTPQAISANFSFSPSPGYAGSAVAFTDLTSDSPISWDWNFGDYTANVTTQNPIHTYASRGNYTVSLIVSNGYLSSSISKTIEITGLMDHQPVVVTNPYVVVYMWQRIA